MILPISRRRPHHSSDQAFTLIELLVVILIIAVLAALLLPAMSTIQRRGYQTTSASNLRQWFVGFGITVADRNGEMPTDGNEPFGAANDDAWYNRIPPTINERPFSAFTTADQPGYGKKSIWINPGVTAKDAAGNTFVFHYGYNSNLVERSNGSPRPMRLNRVQLPHATILMGEKAEVLPTLTTGNVRCYFSTNDPLGDPDGTANFLFLDGHVEALKRSVFTAPTATDPTALDNNQAPVTWLVAGSNP